ncbi:MAG: hypothetical protein ABWU13_15220 [Limnospira maxima]
MVVVDNLLAFALVVGDRQNLDKSHQYPIPKSSDLAAVLTALPVVQPFLWLTLMVILSN